MNKLRSALFIFMAILLYSCGDQHVADVNMAVPENSWAYAKSVKSAFEIVDPNKAYQVSFKLRHTLDYRYSNLYVVMHLKGNGINRHTRYQFKLANANGEWRGQGSGDIYSYTFPLLSDFRFAKAGKYEIEIEQNMRDNPLLGISDVGVMVSPQIN